MILFSEVKKKGARSLTELLFFDTKKELILISPLQTTEEKFSPTELLHIPKNLLQSY